MNRAEKKRYGKMNRTDRETQHCGFSGFISEKNWKEIEEAFPGIYNYYKKLREKPKTFLELQWRFVTSK